MRAFKRIFDASMRDALMAVSRVFDESSGSTRLSDLYLLAPKEWSANKLKQKLKPYDDVRKQVKQDRNNFFGHSTLRFTSGTTNFPELTTTIRDLRKLIYASVHVASFVKERSGFPFLYTITMKEEHRLAKAFWLSQS
ncbi:MAG: hypothetical protein BM558_09035 [Roseobacter sp. MedPE-SW]|nr:MAG: hypothetical protein BM558_09035 [Roseobacter sp. MedPE-SW]